MLTFLHLADLHLGWEPAYLPEDKRSIRRQERDQVLKKAVDFALDPSRKINGVIIVGDLFEHYKPDPALKRQVLDQLHRISRQGMLLITVPGNHDEITYRESVYRTEADNWPGFLVRNPLPEHCLTQMVYDLPVHVYSLAYTGGLTRAEELTSFPRTDQPGFHLGAFHGSLDVPDQKDRSLPLSSSHLAAARYDYIALGHWHQYSQQRIGQGLAVYPGAVDFKSFNDPGTGQLTLVSWDGRQATSHRHPLVLRNWQQTVLDISSIENQEELKARCLTLADQESIQKITLTGASSFAIDLDHLAEALEPSFFHLELTSQATHFSSAFLATLEHEPTVRGLFVRHMNGQYQQAVKDEQKALIQQAMLLGLAALEGDDVR